MSEPRADGPYEHPVTALAGAHDQRRRAIAGVLSIVLVIGGAIGLARLADLGRAGASAAPSAGGRIAIASGAPSPAPTGSAPGSAAPLGSRAPRVETIPDIPDRALPGAPSLRLAEQNGPDIHLLDWTTGAGLTTVRTLHGVVDPADPGAFPILAPSDDRIAFLSPGANGASPGDRGRIVDARGRVLWSGDDLAAQSGVLWSTDGRLAVLAGHGRVWHLVTIAAAGTATDRVVHLPFDVFLPTPLPGGSLTVPRVDPRTIPLGFSRDGRWIYGATISPDLGLLLTQFRVAVDGSRVEPVADLGVGRSDGLLPEPGTIGGRLVDPTTGRVATTRTNPDTSGGPQTLEVREPDAAFDFTVGDGTPLGAGWDDRGGLIVLAADSLLFPNSVTLTRIGPDGVAGPPILATGPLTSAGLIGIRGGDAAIVLAATRPAPAIEILLVDTADPTRISALPLPADPALTITAADLRG